MTLGGSSSPHPVGSWRHHAWEVVHSLEFRAIVILLVLINCAVLAVDVPSARYYDNELGDALDALDAFFVTMFSLEACIKLAALGPFANPHGYFRSMWNSLDFFIVVFGLISLGASEWDGVTSIRALRVLRPLGAISVFGSFKDVLGALFTSLSKLTTIFFLFVVFSLVFGVIGVQLFGGLLSHHCMAGGKLLDTQEQVCTPSYLGFGVRNCTDVYGFYDSEGNAVECVKTELWPGNGVTRFENIGWATLLLFQCMTGSGWTTILYQTTDGAGYAIGITFFMIIMVLGMLFVSNLIIAVLGNAYITTFLKRKKERQLQLRSYAYMLHGEIEEAQQNLRHFYAWLMTPSGEAEREAARRFLMSKPAFLMIMTVVLLSTIFVTLKSPAPTHPESLNTISEVGQAVCSFLFAVEMGYRFYAFGPSAFLRSIWDFLDGAIVLMSILDSILYLAQNEKTYASRVNLLSSASAFRVLRLLLVSRYWTALGDLLKVARKATASLWALLLLLAIITYMFAIVGIMTLGGKFPWETRHNFNDFPHAFLTVLQIVTGEDWEIVMFDAYSVNGTMGIFFCLSVTLIGHYIVLQMFVAVLTFTLQQLNTIKLQRAMTESFIEEDFPSTEPRESKKQLNWRNSMVPAFTLGRRVYEYKRQRHMRAVEWKRKRANAVKNHHNRVRAPPTVKALCSADSQTLLDRQDGVAATDDQAALSTDYLPWINRCLNAIVASVNLTHEDQSTHSLSTRPANMSRALSASSFSSTRQSRRPSRELRLRGFTKGSTESCRKVSCRMEGGLTATMLEHAGRLGTSNGLCRSSTRKRGTVTPCAVGLERATSSQGREGACEDSLMVKKLRDREKYVREANTPDDFFVGTIPVRCNDDGEALKRVDQGSAMDRGASIMWNPTPFFRKAELEEMTSEGARIGAFQSSGNPTRSSAGVASRSIAAQGPYFRKGNQAPRDFVESLKMPLKASEIAFLNEAHKKLDAISPPLNRWELQLFDTRFIQAAKLTRKHDLMLSLRDVKSFLKACGEDVYHLLLVLRFLCYDGAAMLTLDEVIGIARLCRACNVLDGPAAKSGLTARPRSRRCSSASFADGRNSHGNANESTASVNEETNPSRKMSLRRGLASAMLELKETLQRSRRVVYFEKRLEGTTCFGHLSSESKIRRRIVTFYFSSIYRCSSIALLFTCCVFLPNENTLDPNNYRRTYGTEGSLNRALDCVFFVTMLVRVSLHSASFGFWGNERAYTASFWRNADLGLALIALISLSCPSDGGRADGNDTFCTSYSFRAVRALRPLCLTQIKLIRVVMNSLISAIPSFGSLLFLLFAMTAAWAALGVTIFGGKFSQCTASTELLAVTQQQGFDTSTLASLNRSACISLGGYIYNRTAVNSTIVWESASWTPHVLNFDHFGKAMQALFIITAIDDWNSIMFDAVDARDDPNLPPQLDHNYWNAIYVVLYVLAVSVVLMNMFVGVVVQTFTDRLSVNEGYGLLTSEQRQWVHSQKVLQAVLPRTALQAPTNSGLLGRFRRACFRLVYAPLSFEQLPKKHYGKEFEYFILFTIAFNALMMAMRPYPQRLEEDPGLDVFFSTVGGFFNGLYGVEMICKVSGFGTAYFEDPWNQFDFVMVLVSVGEAGLLLVYPGMRQFSFLRILRAMRALRLLRASKHSHAFRQMLATLYYAIPQLINMTLMIFMVLLIFATWGMILFNGIQIPSDPDAGGFSTHANFADFRLAAITIIRMATADGWAAIYTDAYSLPYNPGVGRPPDVMVHFFFIMLITVFNTIFLNVFVAVVITFYDEVSQSIVSNDDVHHFYNVWREFDLHMSGFMPTEQLGRMLCKLGPPFVSATEDGRLQLSKQQLAGYLQLLGVPNRMGHVHFLEVLLPVVNVLLPTPLPPDVKMRLLSRWPALIPSLKSMPASVSNTANDKRLVEAIMAQVTRDDLLSAPKGIGSILYGLTNYVAGQRAVRAIKDDLTTAELDHFKEGSAFNKTAPTQSLELFISLNSRTDYSIQLLSQMTPQLLTGFASYHFVSWNVIFVDDLVLDSPFYIALEQPQASASAGLGIMLSLLLAIVVEASRANFLAIHVPREDTPLRRLVLSLNLDPVNDSRRAACVAYQPLPAQQAFQIGTRTLRNSILKALANNRRQLLATSPALAQLSSPVSDEDILSGGQRAVGIEVARWDDLEDDTQESMVSMAYEHYKEKGFTRDDWMKLVRGLDVGDSPEKLSDPRMKYVMHFSDAVQMKAVRAWARQWRVNQAQSAEEKARSVSACVRLQAHARRLFVIRRLQRLRLEAIWQDQGATAYARRQWIEYYLQMGDFQEAASLGWQPYPLHISRKQADFLATTIQRYTRGCLARLHWQEQARRQWINHFLANNQLAEARALGWQLTPPSDDADVESDAAIRIQSVHRGRMARRVYEFMNLELARLQWVDYYLQKGMEEQARELGWEPPAESTPTDEDYEVGLISGSSFTSSPPGAATSASKSQLKQSQAEPTASMQRSPALVDTLLANVPTGMPPDDQIGSLRDALTTLPDARISDPSKLSSRLFRA